MCAIVIGEIRKALTPFYANGENGIKARPALIIGKADASDYVVLPVSRITRQYNRDPEYDIELDPAKYPLLNLDKVSYVRTHKQTIITLANLGGVISDLKESYPDLYVEILAKREQFNDRLTDKALSAAKHTAHK